MGVDYWEIACLLVGGITIGCHLVKDKLMQHSQRAQRALERERKKLVANCSPNLNNNMDEPMGVELKTFMEMTTKALMDQNERTTQVLLQTLQNMGNSINNYLFSQGRELF